MKLRHRSEAALRAHLNGTVWGGLGGAATMALLFAILLVATSGVAGASELPFAVGNLLIFSGIAFFVAYFCYFLGLLVLGFPVRWMLERLRRTGDVVAFLLGGILSGLTAWLVFGHQHPSIFIVGMAGVAGAIAGVVYRRTSEA